MSWFANCRKPQTELTNDKQMLITDGLKAATQAYHMRA